MLNNIYEYYNKRKLFRSTTIISFSKASRSVIMLAPHPPRGHDLSTGDFIIHRISRNDTLYHVRNRIQNKWVGIEIAGTKKLLHQNITLASQTVSSYQGKYVSEFDVPILAKILKELAPEIPVDTFLREKINNLLMIPFRHLTCDMFIDIIWETLTVLGRIYR